MATTGLVAGPPRQVPFLMVRVVFSKKDQARFQSKVDTRGPLGADNDGLPSVCHVWTAGKRGRYGTFFMDGRGIRAHRASLIFAGVILRDGDMVLHSCDNPPCVNPAHLSVGTAADNARDAIERGRMANKRHLSYLEVFDIKRALCDPELTPGRIARTHGVWPSTVSDIASGKTYRWVPWPVSDRPVKRAGGGQHGERNSNAVLDAASVARMKHLWEMGYKQKELAEEFGVHISTVHYVVTGKTWRHVAASESAPGIKTRPPRLTPDGVREIRSRRDAGESAALIARDFGMTRNNVYLIAKRATWAHVD